MTDNRNATQKALDAGSSFDWITPTYEAVRTLIKGGRSFTMRSEDWLPLKPTLKHQRIPYWGEAIHWHKGQYWYTFSVNKKHAPAVERLTGYRSTGGRGKAIFMLLVLAAVLGGGFLLAAALGALWAAVKGGL